MPGKQSLADAAFRTAATNNVKQDKKKEGKIKGKDLTKGSITGNIMSFSQPYILAYFLQILYGLADLFVTGQYCGYSIISFVHNSISIVTARIPLAWLSSRLYPDTLYPMGLSTGTGSIVSCIICVCAFVWMRRKGKIA